MPAPKKKKGGKKKRKAASKPQAHAQAQAQAGVDEHALVPASAAGQGQQQGHGGSPRGGMKRRSQRGAPATPSYPRKHVLEKMDDTTRVAVQSSLASRGIHQEAIRFVDDMRTELRWNDRSIRENLDPLLETLRHKAQRHQRVQVVDVSNIWLYLLRVHDNLQKKHTDLIRQHKMCQVLLSKLSGRALTRKIEQMERAQHGVKRIEADAQTFNRALQIFTNTQMAKQVEILRDTQFTQVGGATGEYIRNIPPPLEDGDLGEDPELVRLEQELQERYMQDALDEPRSQPGSPEPWSQPASPEPEQQAEEDGLEGSASPPGRREPQGRITKATVETEFEDLDTLNNALEEYEMTFEELLEQEKLIQAREREERERKADPEGHQGSGQGNGHGGHHAASYSGGAAKGGGGEAKDGPSGQSRKLARDRKRRRRKAAAAAAAAASAAAACRAAAIISEADSGIGPFAGMVAGLAGKAKKIKDQGIVLHDALEGGEPPLLLAPFDEAAPPLCGTLLLENGGDTESTDTNTTPLLTNGEPISDALVISDGQALVAAEVGQGHGGSAASSSLVLGDEARRSVIGQNVQMHGRIVQDMAKGLVQGEYDTSWLGDSSQIDPRKLARLLTESVVEHVEASADREVLGTMVKGSDGKCHTLETEVIRRLLGVSIEDLNIRHTDLSNGKLQEIKRQLAEASAASAAASAGSDVNST
uniref:Uncharacterized protein n=1 Tax=Phaeomonas parva TaxID=124430 RepID=A0A7S1TUX9_9STRA|mmetsp:Transcript_18341/g.56028  ORF Transcript_18341/g.56028 Transcript_18341/m.56028 type:complete len:703 (+) Transcript_18341:342-2450(+)